MKSKFPILFFPNNLLSYYYLSYPCHPTWWVDGRLVWAPKKSQIFSDLNLGQVFWKPNECDNLNETQDFEIDTVGVNFFFRMNSNPSDIDLEVKVISQVF